MFPESGKYTPLILFQPLNPYRQGGIIMMNYPENRLDIRVDAQGNITYEENAEFAKAYAPTEEELEEELREKMDDLDDLEHQLDLLRLDEPLDPSSPAWDEWDISVQDLEDRIAELEDEIDELEEE